MICSIREWDLQWQKSQKELSQLEVSFLAIKHELNRCTLRDMDKRYQVEGK